MRFVDTNVLVYRLSRTLEDQPKRKIADELMNERDLALSTQVLQEFYVQVTRSTRVERLSHEQAVFLIRALTRFPVQPATLELVYAALATRERYGISYWDAAIIEAARMLGCNEVLTEDLNHGQSFDGVRVINPFL